LFYVAKATDRQKVVNAYKQSSVETASPAELVLMLFNVCLRSMKEAINCIEAKDYSGANEKLVHAQDITDELRAALDLSVGDLAARLNSLYSFVYLCLLKANVHKEAGLVHDAVNVMTQIRDAWEVAVRNYG
jgi:flagellar protein FliS